MSGNAEGVIGGRDEGNEIKLLNEDKYSLSTQGFNYNDDDDPKFPQDFSTFAASGNVPETTDRIIVSSNGEEYIDVNIVEEVTRDEVQLPEEKYVEARENFGENLPEFTDNPNEHNLNNHGGRQPNLGHQGERPILQGEQSEHGQFHRTDDMNLAHSKFSLI